MREEKSSPYILCRPRIYGVVYRCSQTLKVYDQFHWFFLFLLKWFWDKIYRRIKEEEEEIQGWENIYTIESCLLNSPAIFLFLTNLYIFFFFFRTPFISTYCKSLFIYFIVPYFNLFFFRKKFLFLLKTKFRVVKKNKIKSKNGRKKINFEPFYRMVRMSFDRSQ